VAVITALQSANCIPFESTDCEAISAAIGTTHDSTIQPTVFTAQSTAVVYAVRTAFASTDQWAHRPANK
jgi:hypothetical protein